MELKPSEKAATLEEAVPVDEETLERVRSGHALPEVGRIDVRNSRDELTMDDIHAVRRKHLEQGYRHGESAPIRIRERQLRHIALTIGFGAASKGLPTRLLGHELWVEAGQ